MTLAKWFSVIVMTPIALLWIALALMAESGGKESNPLLAVLAVAPVLILALGVDASNPDPTQRMRSSMLCGVAAATYIMTVVGGQFVPIEAEGWVLVGAGVASIVSAVAAVVASRQPKRVTAAQTQ